MGEPNIALAGVMVRVIWASREPGRVIAAWSYHPPVAFPLSVT